MRTACVTIVVFLAAGCGLRARNHPCYPYLAHLYGDRIPRDVSKELAHDRGAVREVRRQRAPIGAYWRRRRPPGDQVEVHQVIGDHELAPCPGIRIVPNRP